MTTIATDGITIAADGRRTDGHQIISDHVIKVVVRDGRIYAGTGASAMRDVLIAWHMAGADPALVPKLPEECACDLIVIDAKGLAHYPNAFPYPQMWPYPATFGSGSSYAMGALGAGRSPLEAVQIAARLDVYTGGVITVIDIATALGTAPSETDAASLPAHTEGAP